MKDSAGKPAVLIVVENLPVPLDRRVWQEACALRDAGYEVVVICPRMRGHMQSEEKLDGVQIYRHWISEEANGVAGFVCEYGSALWGEIRLAWKAWRRHRFKVIHLCNPPDLLFLVAFPFKLFFGVKVIYDVHDLWPEMFEAKFNKRGLLYHSVRTAERLTYALADVVLATNESVRGVALRRGRKPPERVFVVRTAPKIPASSAKPDTTLKKGRNYLVGYVGVMGDADGVNYLIEAAGHIVNELGRRDVQFLLMGTGPEYERLIAMRDGMGLREYLDLPGRVSNDYLFSALQTMDVGVACDPANPYNDHCTMNKTLEYMIFGKPQVMFATKEGRASAGDAAVYVEENSAEKLGKAISSLLDDAPKRERMGRSGEERIRTKLNWERSVEQLLEAFRAALR
ncbi:MAG TPA: glycosyltransferase family 4 protein [Candidatus Angelobacter sp.]|nr:glycosyltransferase family 4 protein [Candidatus Angelobacter sp.]